MKIYRNVSWVIRLALTATLFLSIQSCGAEEKDDEEESTDSAPSSASGVIGAMDSAFGSIGTSNFQLTEITCENGEPSGVERSAEGYPAKLFACKSTSNSNSPDTIRGSLSMVKGVMCALEEAVGEFEYTTDGTDLVAAAGGSLTVNLSNCFAQSVLDEMGVSSLTATSATATLLDSATTGFAKRLSISVDKGGDTETFSVDFFSSDSKIGIKTTEAGNDPGTGGLTLVTMDLANGVVMYNTIDDRNGGGGSDSAYRRNVRMKVTGTINEADNTFSAVDKIQGIYAQSGGSGSYADMANNYTVVTLNGDSTNGYLGYAYGSDQSGPSKLSESCTGSSDSCASITGFVPTADTVSTFYGNSSGWDAIMDSSLSLCDGGDIDFGATPSVGVLGVCSN